MTDRDHLADWLDPDQVELLPPRPGGFERVRRAARRRRRFRAGSAVAATLVGVAGLAGAALLIRGSDQDALPVDPSPAASTTSAGPAPSSAAPSSPPPSSGPSASNRPVERCHTADLAVSTRPDPRGGAAGTTGVWLVFTNRSETACTMFGFPGVSFVDSAGNQVNDPATRTTAKPARVTLAPRSSAHATVLLHNPDNFGPDCRKVRVAGFRVYPPDETEPVIVASSHEVCSAKGFAVPEVDPITPGP